MNTLFVIARICQLTHTLYVNTQKNRQNLQVVLSYFIYFLQKIQILFHFEMFLGVKVYILMLIKYCNSGVFYV